MEHGGWASLKIFLQSKFQPNRTSGYRDITIFFKIGPAVSSERSLRSILAFHKYYITSPTPVFHTGSLRVQSPANRWRTFGHRAPPIVTERNLQTFLLLGGQGGPPGVLCEKSKHVVLGDVIKLPLITSESKSIKPYPQKPRTTSF